MKTSLNLIKVNPVRQDGPISGDMRQHLQAVSEVICHLPDDAIAPARRSLMALFECLERVEGLENAALKPKFLGADFGKGQDKSVSFLFASVAPGYGHA